MLASATIINLRDRETELLKEESDLRSTYGGKHPRIVEHPAGESHAAAQDPGRSRAGSSTTIENDGEVTASRIKALEKEMPRPSRTAPRSIARWPSNCASWSATPMRPATSTTHSWSATKRLADQSGMIEARRQGSLDGGAPGCAQHAGSQAVWCCRLHRVPDAGYASGAPDGAVRQRAAQRRRSSRPCPCRRWAWSRGSRG